MKKWETNNELKKTTFLYVAKRGWIYTSLT